MIGLKHATIIIIIIIIMTPPPPAGDLKNKFLPSCGASITVWPHKLISGYPGDNRTVALSSDSYYYVLNDTLGAQSTASPPPVGWTELGRGLQETGALDADPHDGAPCMRTPCVFDVEADPNENHDLGSVISARTH